MRKLIVSMFLLLSVLPAPAQELAVAKTNVPEEVPFAQPFAAQFVLSHPHGETVIWHKESVPEEFSVQSVQFQPVGEDTSRVNFTILPFTLNKSTFTVAFSLAGQPDKSIRVKLPLTVTPVKVFDDNELREIRPPQRVVDWVTWLCVLLALAALVCLLIFWMRKLRQTKQSLLTVSVDNRPPHVIALAQIDSLVNSGLWENKQYKVFYITLTDILRTYLERAFKLDVSADTSAELLRRLKTVPDLAALLPQVRQFLASGDLVKFAKEIPTEQTRNRDVTILRELIEKTIPKPPAPVIEEISL